MGLVGKLNGVQAKVCVEIFAIGNELCYGRIYDTNSFWIAERATQLGAGVQRITCVPDDIGTISSSIREAMTRGAHFIITTGGLGPTADDLTIEALSKVFDLEVITCRHILESMAERRKTPIDELTPNLVRMAHSLKGAGCFPNPLGWAPVTIVKNGGATVVALPGPPQEVRACFEAYLAERIHEKTGCVSESRRVIVKMFESQVSPLTEALMKSIPRVYLKSLVSEFIKDKGLPVDIIVFAEAKADCQKKMDETIKKLSELVAQKGGSLIV